MLGVYGSALRFEVQYTSSLSTGSPRDVHVLLNGRNDVTFVFPVSRVVPGVVTLLDVTFSHTTAQHVDGRDVTRAELLLGLSDVTQLLLPASFYSLDHTSRYVPATRIIRP